MQDLQAWLRLQATPGVGTQTAAALLRRYGAPADIFRQSSAELRRWVRPEVAQALATVPSGLPALHQRVLDWLARPACGTSHAVWTWAHASYPPCLLALVDPPLLVYAQGQLASPVPPGIAVVGSRNATPQGLENARAFARHLGDAGFCIVSGLAWGIDTAAHQGALAAARSADDCATLAVVGSGLDRVYPERNTGLAQQIAARGALISEYPPGTAPLAHHFPQRNRLIAAFSSAVLVVEASLKSGSLITARLALDLGREVLAIPGSIHSAQARGCHALIRQGAKLVESVEDVMEELTLAPGPHPAVAAADQAEPSPLLQALGHDPVAMEVLLQRTNLDVAALQSALLALELAGDVTRLPGGLFQRMTRLH